MYNLALRRQLSAEDKVTALSDPQVRQYLTGAAGQHLLKALLAQGREGREELMRSHAWLRAFWTRLCQEEDALLARHPGGRPGRAANDYQVLCTRMRQLLLVEPEKLVAVQGRPRLVRAFVSSTFRDTVNERDYLFGSAFSRVREFCRQRRVTFAPLDLRWGVTEADGNNRDTLFICLREIERCLPYFVCILGGRYGWSVDPFDANEQYDAVYVENMYVCNVLSRWA